MADELGADDDAVEEVVDTLANSGDIYNPKGAIWKKI